jgi:Uma2 family endonuclease
MSLAEFEHAEAENGRLFELGRGVIVIVDVPDRPHLRQVLALRDQLYSYKLAHSAVIVAIASGGECKLLAEELESERHPDSAVYFTAMPHIDGSEVWSNWIPEIAIEVVSPSSRKRDYEEKPDEYLCIGVKEYWIVDEERNELVALRRSRGRWARSVVRPPAKYATRLLPGFELDVAAVFAAAK